MEQLAQYLAGMNVLVVGALASPAAGLMATVGALPLAFFGETARQYVNPMLGLAAGVMIAATAFSLVQSAVEEASNVVYGAFIVAAGIFIGGISVDLFDRRFPYQKIVRGQKEGSNRRLSGIWLFVLAITLHNFPEGLAVGVGFGEGGTESIRNGLTWRLPSGCKTSRKGWRSRRRWSDRATAFGRP